jgi:hypothetical protein
MSFDDFEDGPVWNEHQWEAHLDELEKKSEQLRKFITSDPKGNLPRWITLLRENLDETEAARAAGLAVPKADGLVGRARGDQLAVGNALDVKDQM